MIAAILAFVTGTAGKALAIGTLVVGLLATGAWVMHTYNAAVRATAAVEQQKKVIATIQADTARTVAALELEATNAALDAARTASIKEADHAAPHITTCLPSPAITSAVNGLRNHPANGAGAAAKHPSVVIDLHGAAGASANNR